MTGGSLAVGSRSTARIATRTPSRPSTKILREPRIGPVVTFNSVRAGASPIWTLLPSTGPNRIRFYGSRHHADSQPRRGSPGRVTLRTARRTAPCLFCAAATLTLRYNAAADPSRPARGREHPDPARDGRGGDEAGDALLDRQGQLGDAAPGEEGFLPQSPTVPAASRRHDVEVQGHVCAARQGRSRERCGAAGLD